MFILQGFPPLDGVKQRWGVKTSNFEAKFVNISNTVRDTTKVKLLLVTNRKLHMLFQLTLRSMILDDLELYKFEFSENFAGFRRFRTQQQLNE